MKNEIFIFLIVITIFCTTSCLHRNNKSKCLQKVEVSDTIIFVSEDSLRFGEDVNGCNNNTMYRDTSIMFSTENLSILSNNGIDTNYRYLKRFNSYNEIVENQYYMYYLPPFRSFKVIVIYDDNSDVPIYFLSIIHDNKIYEDESLDITPHWETYDDYGIKEFKIFSDYTIKIFTDEEVNGEQKKYTKYFRINDEGKFYEVSK